MRELFSRANFIAISSILFIAYLPIGNVFGGAQPKTFEIVLDLTADGTSPWEGTGALPNTGTETGGADQGPMNGVVRTFDTIQYRIDWNVNHADATNVTIRATLPQNVSWQGLPPACLPGLVPFSEINNDDRTLVCNVGDLYEGHSGSFFSRALVGGLLNDTPVPLTVTIEDDGAPPVSSNEVSVIASARPRANIVKNTNPLVAYGEVDPAPASPGLAEGYIVYWPISLEVEGSGKGAEGLQPSFSFEDDFTAITPNAKLLDFVPVNPVFGVTAPTSCGPGDLPFAGSTYGEVGIVGPAQSNNSTSPSGNWTCAVTGDRVLTVTVTGADTASAHLPFVTAQSASLGARKVLIAGQIAIFIPKQDVDTLAGANWNSWPVTNTVQNLIATGISGVPNTADNPADNSKTFNLSSSPGGASNSLEVQYYQNWHLRSYKDGQGIAETMTFPDTQPWLPTQTGPHSGDGRVLPGQEFSGDLWLTASLGQRNYMVCGKFDPTRTELVENTPTFEKTTITFNNMCPYWNTSVIDEVDEILPGQPGPSYSWVGPLSETECTGSRWDPPLQEGVDYVIEYGNGGYANWTAAAQASCNDGDSADGWHTDPNAAALGNTPGTYDAITKVRLRMLVPFGSPTALWGDRAWLDLRFKALDVAAGEILPLWGAVGIWPLGEQPSAGNTSWSYTTSGAYNPVNNGNPKHGDRVFIADQYLTLEKRSRPGFFPLLAPGQTVQFELTGGPVADVGAVGFALNLNVVDTLPAGLIYVVGSSEQDSDPGVPSPTVVGQTITWEFGDWPSNTPIPTIRYLAEMGAGVAPFTYVRNSARMTADNVDPSLEKFAYVSAPGAFAELNVRKHVDPMFILPNEDVVFELTYQNSGTTLLGSPDGAVFIDVLPFNGDTALETDRLPPTDFHGTATFASLTGSNGETFLCTTANPASINLDPADPSNDLPGIWIQPCDANATAVRITYPGTLGIGVQNSLTLTLNTSGNVPGDVYTNNFGGRIDGLELPVVSNDVWVGIWSGEEEALLNLGDRVWSDLNQNGIQDRGEPDVNGIEVELYPNSDCSLSPMATTTTVGGLYEFTDLEPGTYCLQFSNLPLDWVISPAKQGGDPTLDSDANAGGKITGIVLFMNDDLDQDMGIYDSTQPPVNPPTKRPVPALPGWALISSLFMLGLIGLMGMKRRRLVS